MKLKKLLLTICIMFFFINITAQINTCGKFEWSKRISGKADKKIIDMATDKDGNIYLLCYFDNDIYFDNIFIKRNILASYIIAKADSLGNWLWAKNIGSYAGNYRNVRVDSSNNIYLTGDLQTATIFGKDTLTSAVSTTFIAKMNTNGDWLWAKQAIAPNKSGNAPGNACMDKKGNIYIYGNFSDSVTFGKIKLKATKKYEIYVAKIDTSGNWKWVTQTFSNSTINATAIKSDKNGYIFISGQFSGNSLFGKDSIVTNVLGTYEYFLSKLDENGNWKWVQKFDYKILNFDVDNESNIYFNGFNAYLLTKLDLNGNILWQKNSYSFSVLSCRNFQWDDMGFFYLSGAIYDSLKMDNFKLACNGATDAVVLKLDSSGNVIWAISSEGSANENSSCLLNVGSNNLIIAGLFIGTAKFGKATHVSGKDEDAFMTKVSQGRMTLGTLHDINTTCGKPILIQAIGNSYNKIKWIPKTFLNDTNSITPIAKLKDTTNYTLILSDACGQEVSRSFTINVSPYKIDLGNDTSINCGTKLPLNAFLNDTVDGVTYRWTPLHRIIGQNTQTPIVFPYSDTMYKITATTKEGCIANDEIRIKVYNPTPPKINFTTNTGSFEICDGGLYIMVKGFIVPQWGGNATYISKPGIYEIFAVDTLSGCPAEESLNIRKLAQIETPDGTLLCPNLNGPKINLIASDNMDSYSWNTGEITQKIQVGPAGIYRLTVTKDNCTDSTSKEITMSSGKAEGDFTYTNNGLTASFFIISNSTSSVFWNFGDGNTSTDENPSHEYKTSGNYDVKMVLKNVCGESAEKIKTIFVSGQSTNIIRSYDTEINIFPNPSENLITIKTTAIDAKMIYCEIKNIQNQILMNVEFQNNQLIELDLSAIPAGIYVLRLHIDDKIVVRKIIKH